MACEFIFKSRELSEVNAVIFARKSCGVEITDWVATQFIYFTITREYRHLDYLPRSCERAQPRRSTVPASVGSDTTANKKTAFMAVFLIQVSAHGFSAPIKACAPRTKKPSARVLSGCELRRRPPRDKTRAESGWPISISLPVFI